MNKLLLMIILLLTTACSQKDTKIKNDVDTTNSIVNESYELVLAKNQKGFLILFPCFPCDAENTKTEFAILETATEHGISVLLMNFNQHLWLSEEEKEALTKTILKATDDHNIDTNNAFIGGFSSGGNVSLLLTDYLKAINAPIEPKGVFIADSPIDLFALYQNAKRSIEKDFAAVAVQEAKWIVSTLDDAFGTGENSLGNYEDKSPYLSKTHSLKNVSHLKDVKIRLYSEPDTIWWKENRLAAYEDMNAYYIEQLAKDLYPLYGENNVSYIQTENRGYRSSGERHPHSWSIIDAKELVDWILEE